MKKLGKVMAAAIAAALMGALVAVPLISADANLVGDQSDSVHFTLHLAGSPPEWDGVNDVVYCGVKSSSEPYVLDVAVSSPAYDPHGTFPDHNRAAWLMVDYQGRRNRLGEGSQFNVPFNDSYSFNLTLGGRVGFDQMVQLLSPPKGDEAGGGSGLTGFATVRAQRGAVDPFIGDGRSDNFCLSIGFAGSGEFTEGEIRTALSVPDSWVMDGNGEDGGFLVAMPH